jgi:HSP20 family molecular chaperone IbpA
MGVDAETKEDQIEEVNPQVIPPVPKIRKKRQAKVTALAEEPAETIQELKIAPKQVKSDSEQNQIIESEPVKKIEIEGIGKPTPSEALAKRETWFEEPAGQLAIDVFQTEQDLIIQTAIAGIKPGNLEVTVERDIIAIRGIRQKPSADEGEYFTKECYWGPFAREIIVPVEIDPDRVEAIMQEGILIVRMPKILREKKRVITVKA